MDNNNNLSIPNADLLLTAIAKHDYDSVVLIDPDSGSVVDIYHGSALLTDTDLDGFAGITYDEGIRKYLPQLCADLNPYDVLQKMQLSSVTENLQTSTSYHVYYLRYNTSGIIMRKKVSFYNTDEHDRWICCTVRDVTDDYMRMEEQRKKLQEALMLAKNADKSKSEFLTHVSREVRTPLSSIKGYIRLAEERYDEPDVVRECLNDVKTSVNYINEMIEDVLDIRQIGENRIVLKDDIVEIRELLHDIERIARPRMQEKHMRFSYETVNMSYPRLVGDYKRLKQIIIKLLDNAIRQSGHGGMVHIIVKEEIKRKNTASVEISVRDDAGGISKDRLSELFKPFNYHTPAATGRRPGLGLSLVKSFVDAMGGTIMAESKEGVGSNFIVTLEMPVSTDHVKQEQEIIPDRKYDFSGKTVLVAEDHPLNMIILKKYLEKAGFNVITAVNGQEAVEKYNTDPGSINVILMDIRMPVMDGLEAAKVIRSSARKHAKDLPIIAMTADVMEEDIQKSFESGMDDHLAKPIDPIRLYETVSRYLSEVKI